MTKVAILPIATPGGNVAYHAVAGDRHSEGKTAGEALDALTAQLPKDGTATMVIVQNQRPDCHFDAGQQRRLAQLMARWRAARDGGGALAEAEQAELEALVEEELHASAERAEAMLLETAR